MEEVDIQNCLKFDDQRIKSLDLPTLRKISPIYDSKHKEVSKHLETLETERSQLKHALDGIKIKKSELENLFLKREQIFNELSVREHKAEQELAKAKVMCPIYQFQMTNFLEEACHHKTESGCPTPFNYYNDWAVIEENLIGQKETLKDDMDDKQQITNDFARRYLE